MQQATVTTAETRPDVYEPFLVALAEHFRATAGEGPLFTTKADGLFGAFIAALPEDERQHHTCHACRRFVETYGNLVTITDVGRTEPVMWGEAPGFYGPAFAAVRRLVARAEVDGVHVSSERVWGQPVTGAWRHMAVEPPLKLIHLAGMRLTAFQVASAKAEDYKTLQRGLADFTADAVAQALTLLETGALYRSEKCVEVARWLRDLCAARAAALGSTARDNLTWRAVATAPPGFCHPRSTVIGTLLEDIAAGLPFEQVRSRFNAKMDPLHYQRPQAPPSAGNIARAEQLVAELGVAPSLRRRFARLADLTTLWTPAPPVAEPAGGGVFGHLKAKSAEAAGPTLALPPVTMTWEKFARTVLPDAARIEFLVPSIRSSYLAFITAADPAAAPIVQWDREDRRNPVTWYVRREGSPPREWNLVSGAAVPVTAVAALPCMWDPERTYEHHGAGVVFVLQGARDLRYERGAGLFPEHVKGELREIRATIEAYNAEAVIEGKDDADACGIDLRKGATWNHRFRVTPKAGPPVTYTLDRWD